MVGGFGTQDQPSPVGGPNTRKSARKVCCSSNELTTPEVLESLSHQDTSSTPRVKEGRLQKQMKMMMMMSVYVWMDGWGVVSAPDVWLIDRAFLQLQT